MTKLLKHCAQMVSFREQKNPHPSPVPKLGCFLFSIGSSNSNIALEGMWEEKLYFQTNSNIALEGMWEEKLYFPLLKSRKRHKAPLGRTVSTHFAADCSFSLVAFSFDSKLLLFSAKL